MKYLFSILSPSIPPLLVRLSTPPPRGLKYSHSCPNMLCSAPVALTPQFSGGMGLTEVAQSTPKMSFLVFHSASCHSPPALVSEPVSSSFYVPSGPDVWGVEVTSDIRPRALSVIAVRPELDTLYKQMNEQNRGEGSGRVCDMIIKLQIKDVTLNLSPVCNHSPA